MKTSQRCNFDYGWTCNSFFFFQFFWNTDAPVNKPSEFKTNDYKPTKYEAKSNAILITMKQNTIKVQKKIAEETTPQIVDNKNINKLIAPIFPSVPSDLIISGE